VIMVQTMGEDNSAFRKKKTTFFIKNRMSILHRKMVFVSHTNSIKAALAIFIIIQKWI